MPSGLRLSVRAGRVRSAGNAGESGVQSALLLTGSVLTLTELAGSRPTPLTLLLAVLLPLLAAGAVCFRRTALWWWLPCGLTILVLFLTAERATTQGFLLFCNGILDGVGETTGRIVPQFPAEAGGSVTAFLVLLEAVLTVPVFLCAEHRLPLDPIVGTAVLAVMAGWTGRFSAVGLWLRLATTVALLLRRITVDGTEPDAVRRARLRRMVTLLLAAMLPLVPLGRLPASADNWVGQAVRRTAHTVRYGDSGVLPEGDLRETTGFFPTEKTALEVVMSRPDSYYLRGFVGETYTGTGWEPLSARRAYQSADVFYWLHREGFFGQTQMALLCTRVKKADTSEIDIQNVGASAAYVYAPYELLSASDTLLSPDFAGDARLRSAGLFGRRQYRLEVLSNQVKYADSLAKLLFRAEKKAPDTVSAYRLEETQYRDFVYQNDTLVPETARGVLRTLLGEDSPKSGHLEESQAKKKILAALDNYTYAADGYGVGDDVLTAFLQQRHGYSIHFATAATLMLRYYGIPARYVEGYLVTPKDVDGLVAGAVLAVPETNAHVWTEYYKDGVGWIPFETTPPYRDVMEKPQDLSGTQTRLNPPPPAENENPDSPEEDPEKTPDVPWRAVQLGACIGLGTLLLLALGLGTAVFLKNRKRLKRLTASFFSADRRLSVKNLFAFSTERLVNMKALQSDREIYEADETLRTQFGEQYGSHYREARPIYEKAVFGVETLTEEERETVRRFEQETQELYRQRRRRRRRAVRERLRRLWRLTLKKPVAGPKNREKNS